MKTLYEHTADFEAKITIFTEKEGGRKTPPLNGIRWDFTYLENNPKNHLYMIWPEFIDNSGDAISRDIELKGTYNARMHILNEELKKEIHRPIMVVGTEFFLYGRWA